MKTELQEELFNIAPEWFNRGDVRQSLMAFGFECSDGWFEMLKSGMEWIRDTLEDEPVEFEVLQVKEKFGTLRFYVHGGNDHTERIIEGMEMASHFICENCGAAGVLTCDGGWYRTECEDCRYARREERGWKEQGPTPEEEQRFKKGTGSEG